MKLAFALSVIIVLALLAPATGSAANGNYTQILCFNPDTGKGVGAPEEIGVSQTGQAFSMSMDCAGLVGPSKGILASSGLPTHANDGQSFEMTYTAPADLKLRSGEIYRYWKAPRVNPGFQVMALHAGATGNFFADPYAERMDWYHAEVLHEYSWGSRGDPNTAFVGQNRLAVLVGDQRLWRLTLACDSGTYDVGCTVDPGEQAYRLFGGKMVLDDESAPVLSSPASGSLASDAAVGGMADVTVNASDVGSGLYRILVLIDGTTVQAQAIDSNGGRCVDAEPSNSDPYEFGLAVPCRKVASATAPLDTRGIADGTHNVKVLVEDAGGNRTTAVNRSIQVDNVPEFAALMPDTRSPVGPVPSATASVGFRPLGLSFRLNRKRLKNGQVLRYSGKLTGINISRKFVDVQVRNGRRWQVVCSVQTGVAGDYACRHRFTRTKHRTRYIFRARVRGQAGLSSSTITTRSVAAVVRP